MLFWLNFKVCKLVVQNIELSCGKLLPWPAWFYKEDRGAHVYWLKKGIVDARPDHILNLIHYEVLLLFYSTTIQKKYEQESITWKKKRF